MSNKELLNKVIEVLVDAVNHRIIEEEFDKNGEVTYSTSKPMATKETLRFIINGLVCIKEELENESRNKI